MTKHINLQKDYPLFCLYYQIKLPLDIEKSCHRDINFMYMYLLEGKPAPDHATIARFISLHLSQCSKNILAEVSNTLFELGEISGRHVFIDGTKIESIANRYGVQLRMNRSIQAEGSFASVKQDMEFQRYLYRGKENVTATCPS